MKKLQCILLVDDDEITNFINKDILTEMDIAEHVQVCENGKIALEYLDKAYSDNPEEGFVRPDIIFLDLNMPVMDGFEFLNEYQHRFPEDSRCRLVIMLTTSLRGEDIDRAIDLKLVVTDYLEKPLTTEKVSNIMKQYFDFFYEHAS